jgi:4-hydroxy-2-oxoheptanedioate aldolase
MMNNKLKHNFASNVSSLGVWLGIPSVHTARLLARLPLDFMIIDMEHAPTSLETMVGMVVAMREMSDGPAPIVRLSQGSTENIKWALDAGAAGIIAPMINSGEEATRIVSLAKLPPIGTRSFGSSYAGLAWGQTTAENVRMSNEQTLAGVQVESKEALEHLDEIFSTPHLDFVLVGPLDLSLSLGADFFSGEPSPVVEKALERVIEASKTHGVPAGIFCPDAATAKRRIAQGFRMVNVALDTTVLVEGVRKALEEVKG